MFFIASIFCLNGPEGNVLPLPINWALLKQRIFKFMLSNFGLAAKKMPYDFKSLNRDAFPNGYSDLIKNAII